MGYLKKFNSWKDVKKSVGTLVGATVGFMIGGPSGAAWGAGLMAAGGTAVQKVLAFVGEDVLDDVLGLESIGNELADIGDHFNQVMKVLDGKYHDEQKLLATKAERLQAYQRTYEKDTEAFSQKLDSLIAFDDIFKMAVKNQLEAMQAERDPELEKLMEEYKAIAAKIQAEYHFVIGLTQGPFLQKIVGSMIMIYGGLVSDLGDVISGEADSGTFKRIIVDIIMIGLMVLAIIAAVASGGALLYLVVAVCQTLLTIMTLDSMYAGGAFTSAFMSAFDFLFNDVLNLDERVGSDFNKFDSDHEDYQEMVMYVKIALMLTQVAAGFEIAAQKAASNVAASSGAPAVGDTIAETSMAGVTGEFGTAGEAFAEGVAQNGATSFTQASLPSATNAATSMFGGALKIGDTMASSSFLGVSATTYSGLYDAYSKAMSVKDVVTANEAYGKLKDKLEEDKFKLNDAIMSKIRKNFIKSYKDTAYFLQDQQEYIDRYVWSMTANNMYVDPYGTTPVANSRFTPDKDTRMMSFGFEEMFDESKMAGSKGYFNSIIYG